MSGKNFNRKIKDQILQPNDPFSFPSAEKKQAEALRRDHESLLKTINNNRINAAAAPDAINVNALA